MAGQKPIIISSNVATNEYYANYNNPTSYDQNKVSKGQRERVTTALPNMQNNIEYGTNEQQIPWCCMSTSGKEIRSRSMNDRVLLVNQNLYQ